MNVNNTARILWICLFLISVQPIWAKAQTKEIITDAPAPPPRPLNLDLPLSDWYSLAPDDASFKVKFPLKPAHKIETPVKNSGVTIHLYSLAVSQRHFFDLAVADGPPGFRSDLAAEAGADSVSRYWQNLGGKEISRSTFQGKTNCAGTEVVLSVPNGGRLPPSLVRARTFSSGLKVYSLLYGGLVNNDSTNTQARNYFDSLEIVGGCSNLTPPVAAPSTDVTIGIIDGKKDEATGWRIIDRESDGFKVLMPGAVTHKSKQAQVQPVPLTVQTFAATSERAKFVVTTIGPYLPGMFKSHVIHEAILDSRMRIIQKEYADLKYTLTFLKNLNVNGFPGREYELVREAGDNVGRLQVYSTPKRGISFLAMGSTAESAEKEFETFFNSVQIDTTEPVQK